jgi:amidase
VTTDPAAGLRLDDMTAMRDALDTGRVTSTMLVDRAIDRAQTANARLNFIACPTFERARAQALEPRTGPLAGIPTLIKDMVMEKGVSATWGSAALRDFVAPDDSPYTRALADAGLISIARSAIPEFGLNVVTESPLVGPTRNPWNPAYSPGGSSGGAGAAVAAGVVPVAHGGHVVEAKAGGLVCGHASSPGTLDRTARTVAA